MIPVANTANQEDLDAKALTEMCDGDTEFERELLETFLSCQDVAMLDLAKARESEDFPAVKRLAHFTKGGSRSIGAPRLAAVAELLEAAASDHDRRKTLALVCEAEEAYTRLRSVIKARL